MTAPAERLSNSGLSNSLADVEIAVHTHRIVSAMLLERQAVANRRMMQRIALAAGVPVKAIARVGRNMTVDPRKLQREAEEDALIARGTRAGFQVEAPTLFDATTDVSDEEWDKRLRDEGYGAAVWCQAVSSCPYEEPENAALWRAGHDDFQNDLKAWAALETQKRRAPIAVG